MYVHVCIYTHTHTYAYIHIYIIKQHSKIECAALLSDNNNSNAQMSRVKSPHHTTPQTTPHFALCPPQQQRAERTTLHYTTHSTPAYPTSAELTSPHHTHTHYIFPPHLTTSPPHHDSHSSIALSSSGGSSSAATALTAVPIKCSTSISMLSPTQLLMFVCVCCCCCCAPVSSTKSKSTTVRSH